ncbi:MAG: hypothetical protein GXP55_20605 [Deltaproteobacteria bacterium]|nr:hypothetical protein [Deltaproteobacteria bacterium]
MTQSDHERAREWTQIAQAYSRHPSGSSSYIGAAVLGAVAFGAGALGSLGVLGAFSPGVGADEFKQILYPSLALLGLGVVLAPLVVWMVRVARRETARLEGFIAEVQTRGGQMLNGSQLAQWLIRYWAADYPHPSFLSSPEVYRAALSFEGTPVVVDLTPSGYHMTGNTQPNLWWAHVVVPGRPQPGVRINPAHPEVERIRALGYEIALGSGGLIARGNQTIEHALEKQPIGIMDTAAELVRLTRAIEAETARGAPTSGPPLTLS